jgi:hypothetical protein
MHLCKPLLGYMAVDEGRSSAQYAWWGVLSVLLQAGQRSQPLLEAHQLIVQLEGTGWGPSGLPVAGLL